MEERMEKERKMVAEQNMQRNKHYSILESLYVLVLGLYPMRHIYIGLDLWDTGYNYANFQYMGTEHMDSMWLFSTYLANVVGNFLTKLPAADSLAGMNLYTGLFVSILALMGYLFCTRKLNIPPLVAFIGEFVAISLCWCPTALLYNYLTYVLFLGCVIFLYKGLVDERKWCLFAAGICLGTNVLVRFSNLPEAAMIVAVWAYGVIEALEYKAAKRDVIGSKAAVQAKDEGESKKGKSGAWKRTVSRTLWCLGGYLSALVVLFGYIGIRYGLDSYVEGIQRLFAMTDNATDYKATSMLIGMVDTYVSNLYWLLRVGIIVLVGMFGWFVAGLLKRNVKWLANNAKLQKIMDGICYIACVGFAVAMILWLYYREFCSWAFYSYDSMLRPAILFLMLAMLMGVVRVFQRKVSKEEKLISGMVVLVILLTSIGSNNEVFPSINNLFVAAPYTFWQCAKFVGNVKAKEVMFGKGSAKRQFGILLHSFPAKSIMVAFLAMFMFQSSVFGAKFVFAEATGVQNTTATVNNNEILKGIQMSPERAEWMTAISAYVADNDLRGREVILYGDIPSLSYYLQMPSAFNPWSDLESYSEAQMELVLVQLAEEIDGQAQKHPVVIAEKNYLELFGDGSEPAQSSKREQQNRKWQLVLDFIEKYGYEQTFVNEKFVMWE